VVWWVGGVPVHLRLCRWTDVLGIEEESAQLSFGGTGNHMVQNLTEHMDGSIVGQRGISGGGWGVGPRAEEGIPSSAGVTQGAGEVGGITMHP